MVRIVQQARVGPTGRPHMPISTPDMRPGCSAALRKQPPTSTVLRLLVGAVLLSASSATLVAAPGGAEVSRRLHIRNGCETEPMWIAHMAGAHIGVDVQNVKIPPGGVFHFQTPPDLTATRYWPKMGCDEDGGNCTLGSSGGPGQSCTECAPPVDTKFEGTFNVSGWDFVDMSLVDGWTLPFTFKLSGGECHGQQGTNKSLFMDCSSLGIRHCPAEEELVAAGITVDLRVTNPQTKEIVGCYSPCGKLTFQNWDNNVSAGRSFDDEEVAPYCCPTPPETPEHCRAGPVASTSFLEAVHMQCPGVYGFAYDDGVGLLQCTPTTEYEVTFFCPDSHTSEAADRPSQADTLGPAGVGTSSRATATSSSDSDPSTGKAETTVIAELVKAAGGKEKHGAETTQLRDEVEAEKAGEDPLWADLAETTKIVEVAGEAHEKETDGAKTTQLRGDVDAQKAGDTRVQAAGAHVDLGSDSWATMVVRKFASSRDVGPLGKVATSSGVVAFFAPLAVAALVCAWLRQRRRAFHDAPSHSQVDFMPLRQLDA